MKPRLTPREQRSLLVVVPLAGLILWAYGMFVSNQMRDLREVEASVRAAKDQLKGIELATQNETALKVQEEQLQETVAAFRKLLPPEEELPRVIELLSDMASQSQVKIQSIFPQRPVTQSQSKSASKEPIGPVVYKDVIIQIDALTGFHQLGLFLSMIESAERPMQVNSLRITTDPKESRRHHVKLYVESYFAVTDASVPGAGAF
jgi:Tfp pilus assembly protein PilO